MAQVIKLGKGQKIDLAKEAPAMKTCFIGLGWKEKDSNVGGYAYDLDASVLLVGADGKVDLADEEFFIYYNKLAHSSGGITHSGDNREGGDGDEDDEVVNFDFNKIPAKYSKAIIVVTIDKAEQRRQNFGQVESAFARLVNAETNEEIARADLEFEVAAATGVQFCSLIRRPDGFAFSHDSIEFEGGLAGFLSKYGVQAS